MQQEYSFDQAEERMAMQGGQFQDNMGLQRRGQMMSRDFTQVQWNFQDQMRGLQRGWQVEDFGDEVRFMTGRQRKKAERGFERSTIMYNVQGEQIDAQREHQQELWELEDARFQMVKDHYSENETFQKAQMETSRKFYEERKRLEEEQNRLARAYATEQMKIQRASTAAQQKYNELMRQAQKDLAKLQEVRQDEVASASTLMMLTNDWIDTSEAGLKKLLDIAVELAETVGAEITSTTTGTNRAPTTPGRDPEQNPRIPMAGGGYAQGGGQYWVGDNLNPMQRGEIFSPASSGHVVPISGVDPWNRSQVYDRPSGGGGSPQVINVYVGGEKLATMVVGALNDALEVT